MAHQAFSLPSYPKCIRKEDFELIKSIETFELYQEDYLYGSLLPVLSREQFLTIHSFSTYASFHTYLFDTFERDWTSNNASVSCSQEQFDKDWDAGIAELIDPNTIDSVNIEGEEDSSSIYIYNQPYNKGREVRADRRRNSWLAQKRAFCVEKILKAKEQKEDFELQKKVHSIQKALLKAKKNRSKEVALEMAEKMVSLKPKVNFARARFSLVTYNGAEEIAVYPFKKRAAKTFHEKHKKMKKCAKYHKKLQEIRDITHNTPGHNRKEAKHVYNVKHSKNPTPVNTPQENTSDLAIHPAYHNAIVRVVTGKRSISFELDTSNSTPVSILMSKSPITAKILSILCTLNH